MDSPPKLHLHVIEALGALQAAETPDGHLLPEFPGVAAVVVAVPVSRVQLVIIIVIHRRCPDEAVRATCRGHLTTLARTNRLHDTLRLSWIGGMHGGIRRSCRFYAGRVGRRDVRVDFLRGSTICVALATE